MFFNNIEVVFGFVCKKKKMIVFCRGLMLDNKLKCFVLVKSKNFMVFKVFSVRRDKWIIVLFVRFFFKFCKFDMFLFLIVE